MKNILAVLWCLLLPSHQASASELIIASFPLKNTVLHAASGATNKLLDIYMWHDATNAARISILLFMVEAEDDVVARTRVVLTRSDAPGLLPLTPVPTASIGVGKGLQGIAFTGEADIQVGETAWFRLGVASQRNLAGTIRVGPSVGKVAMPNLPLPEQLRTAYVPTVTADGKEISVRVIERAATLELYAVRTYLVRRPTVPGVKYDLEYSGDLTHWEFLWTFTATENFHEFFWEIPTPGVPWTFIRLSPHGVAPR